MPILNLEGRDNFEIVSLRNASLDQATVHGLKTVVIATIATGTYGKSWGRRE